MPAQRLSACISAVVAVALLAAAPARAEEPIEVAVLEAQVEAAAELAELPTEPDWGVPDASNSPPSAEQGAPEVPAAPVPSAETAPQPRYHVDEPQYHAEYQPPEADPAPPRVVEAAPLATSAEPPPEPAIPAPTEDPVQPQASATPTIWIWVWNWSWDQALDQRYRNSDDRYQNESFFSDADIDRILDKIATQTPVQINVQNGSDIAGEILQDAFQESEVVASPAPALPLDRYRAAPERRKTKPAPSRRHARGNEGSERLYAGQLAVAPPHPLTSPEAASAARKQSGDRWPRARSATRRAPSLPLSGERLTDAAAASSASVSLFKTIAVLVLSLLLAAFGHGRRIWLPAARWRGLLGTQTDPPG